MIACRELAIPPNLDILYVEQEAEADDSTAVEAVLKADTKRTELLKREKELQADPGQRGERSQREPGGDRGAGCFR